MDLRLWLRLVGINKRYGQYNDSEIDTLYERAKLLSTGNIVTLHQNEENGIITYHIDNNF